MNFYNRTHSNYRVIQQETNCATSSEGHHEVSAAARVSLRWGVHPTAGVSPTRTFKSAVWNIPPSGDLSFNNLRGRGWRDNAEWATSEYECQSVHAITIHRSTFVLIFWRHSCCLIWGNRIAFLNRNILPPQFLRRELLILKNWVFFTLSENVISTLQAHLLHNININKSNTLMKIWEYISF
jgi:hypothetical protein